MASSVFVSYSHADEQLVQPIVRILRTTKDWVFLDQDSISPGENWREEIRSAISAADLILVFWCRHASQSSEVRREFEMALQQNKELVPVRLDATSLPDYLAKYHAIDLQQLSRFSHRLRLSRVLLALLGIGAAASFAAWYVLDEEPIITRGAAPDIVPIQLIVISALVLVFLGAMLATLWKRRKSTKSSVRALLNQLEELRAKRA